MGILDYLKQLVGMKPPTLKVGSRGASVQAWQEFAMKHDGIFGPVTEAATKVVQTRHGLEPTGIVDDMTWKIATDKVQTGQTGSGASIALLAAEDISTDRTKYASGELWARAIIVLGFRQTFKRNPTLREAQFGQAVARGESGYGRGWKDAGIGSHNWGAVQAGRPPCDPNRAFPYGDTHADGSKYAACFRKYPDDVTGAADFLRIMFKPNVIAAANAGDIRGVSTAMRANRYFELALDKHVIALTRNLTAMTTALNEPMPTISSGGGAMLVLLALPIGSLIYWLKDKV